MEDVHTYSHYYFNGYQVWPLSWPLLAGLIAAVLVAVTVGIAFALYGAGDRKNK